MIRLIGIDALHRLQDRFAALGQVSVCICTVDGEMITEPTWGSTFSAMIGNSPLGQLAFKDSLRGLTRGLGGNVPAVCHEGLTLYAASIADDGECLAVIVVGTRSGPPPTEAQARAVAATYGINPDQLAGSIDRTTPHTGSSPEATHRFADVLAGMIATLYHQAVRIQAQLDDLSVVHGLANLLAGTQSLQETLDRTVERVVEVMPVKACGIRLLQEETGELVIQAVHNLSEEYLQKGRILLDDSPIDAAAFAGETVYVEDAPNDPRVRFPQNARREGIVSGLCVPLTFRGRTVGVLRVYTSRKYRFSESEAQLLRSIASQAASAIINSRLFEEQVDAERMQRQIDAAAEIQRRMLPTSPPKVPGLTFGYVYDPALSVGGDFYDFIELPGGEVGVVVADVVGKGLPAALMMASVRSALRASTHCDHEVNAAVAAVNRHMYRDTLVSEFATLVYGKFSPDGSTFSYCNAGHPPPLLLRGDRMIELTQGGTVIGACPDESFEKEVVAIQSEDVLLIVTDGVTEALNFQDEMYGSKRLRTSLRKHRSLDAQHLAQQILWDVRRFVGLAHQSDDITIVVVKAA
ncbi:MAG: SpoIIE family protein phosphatase [Planctomycetes bacterium]|nr:SpoIIE family protein phosphatase [Planctomycetota bacterium]